LGEGSFLVLERLASHSRPHLNAFCDFLHIFLDQCVGILNQNGDQKLIITKFDSAVMSVVNFDLNMEIPPESSVSSKEPRRPSQQQSPQHMSRPAQ